MFAKMFPQMSNLKSSAKSGERLLWENEIKCQQRERWNGREALERERELLQYTCDH